MRNEFTSCRNVYAEMILWHDLFSAKTHVLEKFRLHAAESVSFFRANGVGLNILHLRINLEA